MDGAEVRVLAIRIYMHRYTQPNYHICLFVDAIFMTEYNLPSEVQKLYR